MFFKCLDNAKCGRKMTYLVDAKGCNMCGAPCEILDDPALPAYCPDNQAETSFGPSHDYSSESHINRKGIDSDKIAQNLSKVNLGKAVMSENSITSILDGLKNKPQDFNQGRDIFCGKVSPRSSSHDLIPKSLGREPDSVFVFGGNYKRRGSSLEPNLFTNPPQIPKDVKKPDRSQNDASLAVKTNNTNSRNNAAYHKPQNCSKSVSASIKEQQSSDEPHMKSVQAEFTLPKKGHDQDKETRGPFSNPDSSSTKTSSMPQEDLNLPYLAVAEQLVKEEKKRKQKDKKKARKARKQAEAATAKKAPRPPAALKNKVNTSPPPIAVLEKPGLVTPETPTQVAWNALVRKGRFTKETTMTERKEVNASSYLVRETDENENTPRQFVEVRFNIGKVKHDSKRIVPRHVLE